MKTDTGTVPHHLRSQIQIEEISGTSPRDDLRDHPTVAKHKPGSGETCLCQYDGTNVLQWHYRNRVYWVAQGPLFFIEE